MSNPTHSGALPPGFEMARGLRQPPLGRRLRLGFVGGGRGGQVGAWHAAGARLSAHWDIVAGALSADPEIGALSAHDWGIDERRSYSDYRAMAAAEAARTDGIEAVAICTPNSGLPLELKGDPSCSEPDPDSLNLSSLPMNAPDLAPGTPPAQRVRAWAQTSR